MKICNSVNKIEAKSAVAPFDPAIITLKYLVDMRKKQSPAPSTVEIAPALYNKSQAPAIAVIILYSAVPAAHVFHRAQSQIEKHLPALNGSMLLMI